MGNKNLISVDTTSLEKIGEQLGGFPKDAVGVLNRVLRRTTDYTRVEIARQVPRVYGISQAQVKASMKPERRRLVSLTNSDGGYGILVVGATLKLARFSHSPSSPPGGSKRYKVTAKIINANGRKVVKAEMGTDGSIKNPFIAPTGTTDALKMPFLIYVRTGNKNAKGRESIRPLSTVSIPQMVLNAQVAKTLLNNISTKVDNEVGHELAYALEKEFGIK